MPEDVVLTATGLAVTFAGVPVVKGIDFSLRTGQTLGLVGESGSGKTMTALSLMGLVPDPGRIAGSMLFQGQELVGLPENDYEKLRGGRMAMVFQDPSTALNPVMRIEDQLVETIRQHHSAGRLQARQKALEALKQVEIPRPERRIRDYPHTLSGGMKQRIMLAMALACEPELVIMDEPTTALDVTVQSQILDLVERLQRLRRMAILLISHDLGVVAEISDEIAVMHSGRIVEYGTCDAVLRHPAHPYTQSLLNAIPKIGRNKQPLPVPQTADENRPAAAGCSFAARCPRLQAACREQAPAMPASGHGAACWLAGGKP